MKGVWVQDWTEFKNLTLEEIEAPGPLKSNEVRIDTYVAGVSFAASLVVAGRYQRKPPLPFVPGTEVAGVVSETGSDVSRLRVGDRVCGAIDWGAMGEQAIAQDATVFSIPDSVSFAQAVGLPTSYMTSMAGLTWPHILNVQPGQTLLVHGGAGGVGLAAIEIGKILGATVIATAGADDKLEATRDAGADFAINYRENGFRTAVLELTNGLGVDAVYDPVGGDVFDESLRCLAPEGRISPIGFAAGRIPSAPANILLVKNISVCGLNMGYYYGWSPNDVRYQYAERLQQMMETLTGWCESGQVRPRVAGLFPLENFQDAMRMVLERKSIGRVGLIIRDE